MIVLQAGRASFNAARWTVPVATLVLWALAALSAGWWGLKMSSATAALPLAAPAQVRQPEPVDPATLGRLLGAEPASAPGGGAAVAAPSLASRFVLMGVVADLSGRGSVLMSVDGQPPKPYRVGSSVADGLVLQSVQGRRAAIGAARNGPPSVTLELPPLAQ